MIQKYILPIMSLGMLLFALIHVVTAKPEYPKAAPPAPPAASSFAQSLAAVGLVEAQTENIAVGAYVSGVVTKVSVQVGDKVPVGAELFRLDDRVLLADVQAKKSALKSAEVQLSKLLAQPRAEEVPAWRARVREANSNLVDHEDQLRRAEVVFPGRAISEEELLRKRQAVGMAREQLARHTADLNLLLAGAWQPDKEIAQAGIEQAKAQLKLTEAELERLTVRALVAGEVLQVNVRPGEFVGNSAEKTLLLLGNVEKLHLRVDIDEHDIARFNKQAPAKALLRGQPHRHFPLTFVRVEPFVLPKKSLTGDNTERVDTRVLQVIYALENPEKLPVYVGQQVDVFIETQPTD